MTCDFRLLVDLRVQQRRDGGGLDAHERFFTRDVAFFDHVGRDLHRGGGAALARTGLQDVELAALDRELDVLHVVVVLLELVRDVEELLVDLRLLLFEL